MIMRKNLKQMQSHANYGKSAMKTGDHFKNGASPKSLTSRGNCFNLIQKLCFIFFLFMLFACREEDTKDNNDAWLISEEELAEFYSGMEGFLDSPDVQSYNTIAELIPAMENYLKRQSEIEKVKIEENILTVYFKGGKTSKIEFDEPTELVEEIDDPGFEPETVDESYFATSASQNTVVPKQIITRSQSTRQVTNTNSNEPNYIRCLLWEPFSVGNGYSGDKYLPTFSSQLNKILNGTTLLEKKYFVYQDLECDPDTLKSKLSTHSPNIIIFNTHGNVGGLSIGSCSSYVKYTSCKDQLKRDYEIVIADAVPEVRIWGLKNKPGTNIPEIDWQSRYIITLTSSQLSTLLNGVDLSNTIVFVDACESASGGNNSIINVFAQFEAAYVVGFSGRVKELGANMFHTETILENLLLKYYISENNKLYRYTVDQAFNFQKRDIGIIQNAGLLSSVGRRPGFKFAPPVNNANYSQTTHVTGVAQRTKLPVNNIADNQTRSVYSSTGGDATQTKSQGVVMFGCRVNYHSLNTGYSKSYCGLVYSSKTDNPMIGDGKSKHVWEPLDHEIIGGEDFYFSFNDIEYNKQYYYRSFVRTEYATYYSEEVEPFIVEGEEEEPDKDWVEIDGVKWATRNVGAPGTFVENPEDYGEYYAQEIGNLYTDNLVQNACPTGYRLPTANEFSSLESAPSEWVSRNGVAGRVFGTALNTIFLPAAGALNWYHGLEHEEAGWYWSSTFLYEGESVGKVFNNLHIDSDIVNPAGNMGMHGMSIRCVKE
jgi:uncharacterized protein (TIGR02145 family)